MRIGIDHHIGLTHAPGSGRYIRELTRALTEIEGDFGLRLFDFGRSRRIPDLEPEDLISPQHPRLELRRRIPLPRRMIGWMGRVGWPPDRILGGVDWFHSVQPLSARCRSARMSATIGDLPTDRSGDPSFRESWQHMSRIFVFSQHAANVVCERLLVPRSRVRVVPVGADHWARQTSGESRRTDIPRIIVLGTQRTEREPLRLLRAAERLTERGLDFVLSFLGRTMHADPEFERAWASSPIRGRIERREPTESELPALVASAAVLVHLDREALTAVTPLEACAAGCPVIVNDSPVFREVLAADATYLSEEERGDAGHFAQVIASECERSFDAQARLERRRLAQRYDWRTCARAHVAVWNEEG